MRAGKVSYYSDIISTVSGSTCGEMVEERVMAVFLTTCKKNANRIFIITAARLLAKGDCTICKIAMQGNSF